MSHAQWEYKLLVVQAFMPTETTLPNDLNEKINALGAEGWELVKMLPIQKKGFIFFGVGNTSYTDSILMTFKRLKKSQG